MLSWKRLWSRRSDYGPQAVYEDEPQLPGKQGETQAILGRLWSEARGQPITAMATCNDDANQNSKSIGTDKGSATVHGVRYATSQLNKGSAKMTQREFNAVENLLNKGRSSRD